MPKVFISNKFKRSLRKFVRSNLDLQRKIEQTVTTMEKDLFSPPLGTHKLSGKLLGLLSCSCGYDCRIVFSLTTDDNNEQVIVLLDIGTHDEVY
ncbi:type II toxin-antitoxin system YafQ family toxin [Geminocystis sp.]|uniref:type II toxin-antitoxin system RelE/ParE family toxin n=1 Tax=Geminocystis sp. TaxID=2664100 RepID=UPI0035931ACA